MNAYELSAAYEVKVQYTERSVRYGGGLMVIGFIGGRTGGAVGAPTKYKECAPMIAGTVMTVTRQAKIRYTHRLIPLQLDSISIVQAS